MATLAPCPYHASVELAQHGGKSLEEALAFAGTAGAAGVQPSNFHFLKPDGSLLSADEIKAAFSKHKLKLDGVSSHCWLWVHGTAWTQSPTIRPFIPENLHNESPEKIEQFCENNLIKLFDLMADLGIKVTPTFFGVLFGWEIATGYPWGFWKGPGYDFIQEGLERAVDKTAKIRSEANQRGIKIAHEIHPGTGAVCADDFLTFVNACDNDSCLGVNGDPSHNWEGESWRTRLDKVGHLTIGAHVKDHFIDPGRAVRCMEADWKKRPMRFTELGKGQINLDEYAQKLFEVGYPQRYCDLHNTSTAPLVGEAESAFVDLDVASGSGIKYIRDNLCLRYTTQSFEDDMGD